MSLQKRVWVYARIKEHKPETLLHEMFAILQAVQDRGYQIVGSTQEIYETENALRPSLIRVMDAAQEGEIDSVLVRCLSQLSEDMDQLYLYMCLLQDCRVTVIATESDIFTDCSSGGIANRLLARAARNGLSAPWE